MNNSQIYLKAIGHLTAIETSDGYTGYTVYVGMCEAIDRVCEARNLDRRGYITNPYSMQSSTNQELRYFNFVDTINGFSNLKTNWDSYNADAISKNAIDTAIETLNYLLSEGLLSNGINISVFPMRDGGVQFEFEGENICSELEINPSGELTFILFDDNGNIVDKWQLFELSELSTFLEEAQYA